MGFEPDYERTYIVGRVVPDAADRLPHVLEQRRKAMAQSFESDGDITLHPSKKVVVKPTDQELLDAVNKARAILAEAIDTAIAAGLEVDLRINTEDTVSPRYGITKVRSLPATAVRRIK